LATGYGRDELLELVEYCDEWTPPAPEPEKSEREKLEPGTLEKYGRTDHDVACLLRDQFGEDIRFVYPAKAWHIWDGRRWKKDDGAKIHELFELLTREALLQAAERSGDVHEALIKWVMYVKKQPYRKSALALAETSLKELKIMADELDRDSMLLNVLNGTLDLRTGELRPHNRVDMITRCCPVEYHQSVQSRDWNDFLSTALPDPTVRSYVQKAAGYALTGDVSEEKLFFAYGPPATGKSTFLSAVQAVLGDYGCVVEFTSFLTSRLHEGGARSDIAGLAGQRFVCSIEVENGAHLAEGLLSLLTGGDRVRARFLYHESEEFLPTFKIFLAANNRPEVSSGESALWRRLKLIPFNQVIAKPDPKVKKILSDPGKSGPAILAWLVEGCLAWQQEGLKPEPDAVAALTEEYRYESDPIREFIEEKCVLTYEGITGKQELYDCYREFCEKTHNKFPLSQKIFNKRLFARGMREKRISGVGTRSWTGIKTR